MSKTQNEHDHLESSSGNMSTERADISVAFMPLVALFTLNCIVRWEQVAPTGSFSLNVQKFKVILILSQTHTNKRTKS